MDLQNDRSEEQDNLAMRGCKLKTKRTPRRRIASAAPQL
jgi:hypothetical protein